MGYWNWLSRLRMPKMPNAKDVIDVPKQIKEEAQKSDANLLYVKYFSKDGVFVADSVARIQRDTEFEIAYCRVPEPLGFIILPGGKKFNVTTKRTEIYLIEGYCASLVMKDIYHSNKIEEKERNDYAAGIIGKEGYLTSVLPEDLPHIDTTIQIGSEKLDIIPKTLAQMGTSKWMEGMTEKKIDGVAIIMILGVCIGFVLSSLLNAFARGG
jgi:hypothetical protein